MGMEDSKIDNRRRGNRARNWFFGVIAFVIILVVGTYQYNRHMHHLRLLPPALGVSKVLYVAEESLGIGLPSDNETGMIVYEMPEALAKALSRQGIAYLEQHGKDKRHPHWNATPVPVTDWGSPSHEGMRWVSPGIGDFLAAYGFPVRLDPDFEKLTNDAIFQPGSFYAYGRGDITILMPERRRIVFAYRG